MRSIQKELWTFVRIFFIAIIFAYLINHFLFAPYVVKGESMHPSLQEENKLIVNKLSPFDHLKRFDIIVFHAPDTEDHYVKRIIGLPGDEIKMKNDVLYINGKVFDESFLIKGSEEDILFHTGNFTLEELTGYEKVPRDSLFVLGDNRAISKDSRYFGLLSRDDIIGKAVFRIWPFKALGQVE